MTTDGGSCSFHGCLPSSDVEVAEQSRSLITVIDDLENYEGDSVSQKIDSIVEKNAVVIIGYSHCPYCLDVRETLANEMGVRVHVIETDSHDQGAEIQKAVQHKTGSTRMPFCFINGKNIGGCDDVRDLQASGQLECMLGSFAEKVVAASSLDHYSLPPTVERGNAVMPLFYFPPTVNHHAIRVTGILSSCMAVVSVVLVLVFPSKLYGQWIGAYLVGDFFSRVVAGGSMSLLCQLGNLVIANKPPDLRPGPPKQFAACCGLLFTILGSIFYFVRLPIVGAVCMALLALAAGMEGFGDFCLGCFFFSKCIQYGLVPDYIYRIHSASRPELIATWKYANTIRKNTPAPFQVVTDPDSKIGLKYKVKSDAWVMNDFDPIRNMQTEYFVMPMSLAGLATAFKIASDWGRSDLVADTSFLLSVPTWWSGVLGILGAAFFLVFWALYSIRLVWYPHKCANEWDCPLRSGHVGYMTTSLLLFSYLVYNWDGPFGLRASEWTARCLLWIGVVAHTILVVAKIGEFIGLIHDIEHVHTTWLTLPIGSMVAAFIAPLVPMLGNFDITTNVLLAQFFYSFAFLLWVTLFVITFLKVVTMPNSNNAHRHTIFMWLAAPCTVGLANYSICSVYNDDSSQCIVNFSQYYFVGLMVFLCLAWATFPYVGFFGRDPFSMGYWSECFAFGILAACTALFYAFTDFQCAKIVMLMALTVASVANGLALLHTLSAIRRRKVFTPTPKWGPLSYMKLTHGAIRGAIPKLRASLEQINLLDNTNRGLNMFASLFAQFKLVHEEHSRQENLVIFKTFSNYFPSHCEKYIQDHNDDEAKLARWSRMIDALLDSNAADSEKDTAYEHLMYNIPEFLDDQLVHMQGEEDNLQPIGRKYVPVTLQKQLVQESFRITADDRWEVMLPFIMNHCPHHAQRVRYLKCLCWAMPERAQHIGAMVYRHVDAVMWERLRIEVPEITPRGERHWRRYN